MRAAVRLREDFSAEELRGLARRSKDVSQSRRLFALAAVRGEGKDRAEAARIGGMGRQTLRDWVHRFNADGPEGLVDHWTNGPKPRLSWEQLAEFAKIVESGPDLERDGVARWRRVDFQRVIKARFGVDFHERYVGTLLKKLGFSHISVSISIEPGPQIGAEKGPLFRRAFCAVVGVTEGGRSPTGVAPTTAST